MNAKPSKPLYAGRLASLAGVSTDTLRFYERRGLLPAVPRGASGYRLYPPHAIKRVQLIRGALSIGFTVEELAAVFCERDNGGAPCARVRRLAGEKLSAVSAQIQELRSWQRELHQTIAEWDRLLKKTPRGHRAGLLEAFVAKHPTHRRRTRTLNPQRQFKRRSRDHDHS